MVGSKQISVRMNIEIAKELERFQAGSLLSKNMIINRGTRLYVQLLQMVGEDDIDVHRLLEKREFKQLIAEVLVNKRVYWRL